MVVNKKLLILLGVAIALALIAMLFNNQTYFILIRFISFALIMYVLIFFMSSKKPIIKKNIKK